MRRSLFALIAVLALVAAAPAAAQLNDYKNNGSIPRCKYNGKQLGKALGDLPPDIEQYAPGYADELRNARGGGCGSSGGSGGSSENGTTAGAQDRMEDVPAPGAGRGGGSGGGRGGAGATSSSAKVDPPPVPEPEKRVRLANVTSPAITSQPTGPDVPAWAVVLIVLALLAGTTIGVLYLLGADFTRVTRPLGAAADEARARTSDRALELWETVRFGR